MDQKKIGAFLKMLRKEKGLTQEQLAEQFGVAGRTVSRWETGYNMPDLSILVELADFYCLDLREILDGERKDGKMEQEVKETLTKAAAYSREEKRQVRTRTVGVLMVLFGTFTIVSAMMLFPADSSWGSIYSVLGTLILTGGLVLWQGRRFSPGRRVLAALLCFTLILGSLCFADYLSVRLGGQVPRFAYMISWSSEDPDDMVYQAPFYTVVRHDYGRETEYIEIL